MVYLGTRGIAAAQIAQVHQFNRDQDIISYPDSGKKKKRKTDFSLGKVEEIHSDFWTLISEINSASDAYILKTANRIYREKTYPFHNKYLEDMKTYFGTKPQFFLTLWKLLIKSERRSTLE